ncbi:MAG: Fur family transcriptional regulator [Pseudomonadota bacterium]
MTSLLEQKCIDLGLRITNSRRIILDVLTQSDDHPDAEVLFHRARKLDPNLAIATVYRTLKLLEFHGVVTRHDFGGSKSRYEEAGEESHDHLVDIRSGDVIEFQSEELEALKHKIAEKLGYNVVDHRLELYGVPVKKTEETQ